MYPEKLGISDRFSKIDDIINYIRSNKINMYDKLYLRRNIWDVKQKSSFIESIFLRIPISTVCLDVTNLYNYHNMYGDDEILIIDGWNRINSVWSFMQGDYVLSDLDYFTNLHGLRWEDLPNRYKNCIDAADVSIIIIDCPTQMLPTDELWNLYRRINPHYNITLKKKEN
jgi:hypothetical protein